VVAPVQAVVASIVPVAWGLTQGEHPSVLIDAGIAVAIAAAGVIAVGDAGEGGAQVTRGVPQAVLGGIAFGASLILYTSARAGSGQWPVLMGRLAALAVASIAFLVVRARGRAELPSGHPRVLAATAGVFDVGGTALLVFGARHALLVIVAPLAALAPGFTVLLARVVGGERLRPAQRIGVALAVAGLVLIAAG
jgi:drug/metabolite transporter (DMT)-like permease